MTTDLPPDLIDLQRTVHAAWAAVEAHRRQVDAARAAETPDVPGRPAWIARPMRPRAEAEDAEHARLMDAATAAAEALRQGVADASLDGGYDVTQELHKAARGE